MNSAYIPKLGFTSSLENPFSNTLSGYVNNMPSVGASGGMGSLVPPGGVQALSGASGTSFQNVLQHTINSVNHTLQAPDALMKNAMTTGSVDVHDVMIANAKAELVVNVASQMTTKVLQAYDRILQIQI